MNGRLQLLDSKGELSRTAFQEVMALVEYPFDEASRRFVSRYIALQLEDLEKDGLKHELTAFELSVQQRGGDAIGQKVAAGVVTLFLYSLIIDGEMPVTKYRASKLASEFLSNAKRVEPKPARSQYRFAGELILQHHNVPTGTNNVEKAFKKYSLIGSIMAARLLLGTGRYPESRQELNRTTLVLIGIAQRIEDVVYAGLPSEFSEAWWIGQQGQSLAIPDVEIGPGIIDEAVRQFCNP